MNVQDVLSRLKKVKARSDGKNWDCLCPAHDDQHASLSVGVGDDGKIVIHCQRGCTPQSVVSAIGLKLSDLFQDANGFGSTRVPRIAATYDYCDETGCLLYQAVRFDPKDFRQRRPATAHPRPDVNEDWHWNMAGIRRVLYRLPELTAAEVGETIWIAEGEKDVEALRKLGLTATTNAMGAGKWRKEYAETLRGRKCVILPDNDEPGRQHAETVRASLQGVASSVRILTLPGLPDKGDVSDWLAAGGTKDKLLALLVVSAASAEKPVPKSSPSNSSDEENPFRGWKHGDEIIYRGSDVKEREVEFLWPDRIPADKLTTFAGIGGLGKTFVLCDIAARVTSGLCWPDLPGECAKAGQVLFISGEDDPDDTIVPRMRKMGADLSRVVFLKSAVQDRFTIQDLDTLSEAMNQATSNADSLPVRLIAIDPPTAFLGGADDHKNSELRGLLSPLKSWATAWKCAIVFITHFNKAAGKNVEAMMRVIGGVAWVNAVRAAHIFARDPDDPKKRLFVPMKNNSGPERPGMAYRLAYEPKQMAVVEWLGEVETTADDAVNNQKKAPGRGVVASDWMIERFREKREWPSDELFRQAGQDGVSRDAVFAAKRILELPRARRIVGNNGDVCFVWWVPDDWPPLAGQTVNNDTDNPDNSDDPPSPFR